MPKRKKSASPVTIWNEPLKGSADEFRDAVGAFSAPTRAQAKAAAAASKRKHMQGQFTFATSKKGSK